MNRREFRLVDDKSNKFWAVEWMDTSMTVRFGRIGTSGQAQQKSFPSEEAARKEREKLILEKTKKGYQEVTATAIPTPEHPAADEPARQVPAGPSAAEPPVPEDPSMAQSVPAALERSIQLAPADRFVVTWEEHAPLRKPEPPPFDLADAMSRLQVLNKIRHYWSLDWDTLRIPMFPSRQEAHFWLMVRRMLVQNRYQSSFQHVLDQLATGTFDGNIPVEDVIREGLGSEHIPFRCILPFVTFDQLVAEWNRLAASANSPVSYGRSGVVSRLLHGFRYFVLPYLTPPERDGYRQRFAGRLPPMVPSSYYETWPVEYGLGAMVGCHAEIAAVVSHLPDGHYKSTGPGWHDYHQRPQTLVFGLPDAESVTREFRRLGLHLRGPEQARAWLALTSHAALDVLADSVCGATDKKQAQILAGTLQLAVSPEAARAALRIVVDSKAPQVGIEWLARHPVHAAVGLMPLTRGQGKLAEAAREHLRAMRRDGALASLTAALPHLAPEDRAFLQDEVIDNVEASLPDLPREALPETLRAAFAAVRAAKPPAWLSVGALPPVKIGDKKLALDEVTALLAELKDKPVGTPSAVVAALKEHAEPHSLDAFAWGLFSRWQDTGAPPKDRWALGAVGHLGGDGSVLRLTPLVRQWPGESQHQRAVFGLECLRAIGSDTALMALNGIAQKLKFKALKDKAQTLMESIAQTRGLSREQLADRIVPDCDLDERGSRVFDFGPRQFRFLLGPEMKPLVRDAAGKVRPDLPPPNQADDPEKAGAAVAAWKLLKKTLREVLKVQAERLEDAMITGRRWTPEEFRTLLVRHPLMVNLARQLVFAAYDTDGKLTRTFRITEDQTAADQNDDEIDLPTTGQVGLIHPAGLDDAAKNAWGQVLSDYEIIPPFQQMSRAIVRPEPEDLEATAITRYKGPKVPGIVMYGMLERSHWLRDTPADGGGFMQHSKHFPSANLTAFIQYSGMSIGYYDEPQELESVYFVPGFVKPDWWGRHTNLLKIGDVDPIVLSEVLRLANAIVSKAE